jgi:hypothetical protein
VRNAPAWAPPRSPRTASKGRSLERHARAVAEGGGERGIGEERPRHAGDVAPAGVEAARREPLGQRRDGRTGWIEQARCASRNGQAIPQRMRSPSSSQRTYAWNSRSAPARRSASPGGSSARRKAAAAAPSTASVPTLIVQHVAQPGPQAGGATGG